MTEEKKGIFQNKWADRAAALGLTGVAVAGATSPLWVEGCGKKPGNIISQEAEDQKLMLKLLEDCREFPSFYVELTKDVKEEQSEGSEYRIDTYPRTRYQVPAFLEIMDKVSDDISKGKQPDDKSWSSFVQKAYLVRESFKYNWLNDNDTGPITDDQRQQLIEESNKFIQASRALEKLLNREYSPRQIKFGSITPAR